MNETILAELRDLAHERGYESPFADQVAFEKWADKVAPRLDFDSQLAGRFHQATSTARFHYATGSNPLGATNDAIGLLNQAILALEATVRLSPSQPSHLLASGAQSSPPLELPTKITLKWLYTHAPLSLYFWFCGVVAGAYFVGIATTETPLYRALRAQPDKVSPEPANANPPAHPASAAK